MKVESIPIPDIIIGDRRREEYGNVQELADSINAHKLLHPITVVRDGKKFKLVAGGRRIKAFQLLGLSEIPAKVFGELSEDDLRAIELEENLQRLDLSQLERSKTIVAIVEIKKQAQKAKETELWDSESQKSKGRPKEADSLRSDAALAGVDHHQYKRAKEHVEAVKSHPELKHAPQKTAIAAAKLDKPKSAPFKKPLAKPGVTQKSQFGKWEAKLREIKETLHEIDLSGGIISLTETWAEHERLTFWDSLKGVRDDLDAHVVELGERLNELQTASGF